MEAPIIEYKILDVVHESEESLTQRQISEKTGYSVSSVNFALRLLVVKGLLEVSGAGPRRLRYYLTPRGVIEKTAMAYHFLKRQSALYEDVRKKLLGKLRDIQSQGVTRAAVYGWTPVTEAALLFLISGGVHVPAIYVERYSGEFHCNPIPVRSLHEFEADCELLLLMEPLPSAYEKLVTVPKEICYPAV